MPNYRVVISEVVESVILLSASNEEEAMEKWASGEGEQVDTNIYQPELVELVELSD